jgi:hypothetical protein
MEEFVLKSLELGKRASINLKGNPQQTIERRVAIDLLHRLNIYRQKGIGKGAIGLAAKKLPDFTRGSVLEWWKVALMEFDDVYGKNPRDHRAFKSWKNKERGRPFTPGVARSEILNAVKRRFIGLAPDGA